MECWRGSEIAGSPGQRTGSAQAPPAPVPPPQAPSSGLGYGHEACSRGEQEMEADLSPTLLVAGGPLTPPPPCYFLLQKAKEILLSCTVIFCLSGQVSHDFAINFNPVDDECEGKEATPGSTPGSSLCCSLSAPPHVENQPFGGPRDDCARGCTGLCSPLQSSFRRLLGASGAQSLNSKENRTNSCLVVSIWGPVCGEGSRTRVPVGLSPD